MTVKKMLLVMLMVLVTVTVCANGQGEKYGNRHEDFESFIESKEKVALTGVLIIENRLMPELKVGTTVYKLMVPRYCFTDIEVSDGMEVSVEGVVLKVKSDVTTRMFKAGESVVVVEKAVINGEEYDLKEITRERYEGSRGCTGPGNGYRGHGMGFPNKGHFGRGMHGSFDELFE